MEEKKEYLRRIYALAVLNGLCRTQKEFAVLLNINDKGLSSAMNGNPRFLTPSLIDKVRALSLREGLEESDASKKPGGVYLPPETIDMFNNLSETIRLQAELLANNISFPTQKNSIPNHNNK